MKSLFPDLPRSRPRRILGHVIDAGNSDFGERTWAKLQCKNGHIFETHTNMTVTELKRGIPCPVCNPEEGKDGSSIADGK